MFGKNGLTTLSFLLLKGNMSSCWQIIPEDLKRETSRFLHRKYFEVVMRELCLVTTLIRIGNPDPEETEFSIVIYRHVPRWAWITPSRKKPRIRNILFERKRCSGKMASLP